MLTHYPETIVRLRKVREGALAIYGIAPHICKFFLS